MRHAKLKYQLNRFTSWRKATIRSLLQALVVNQSITTTLTKAKALRPWIEKLVNLTKEDTVTNRRRAFRILCDHNLVKLLFEEIKPLLDNRQSGYFRILRLGKRRGDNAQLVRLEFVELKKKEKPLKEKKKKEKISPSSEEAKEEIKKPQEIKPQTQIAVLEKEKPKKQKPAKGFLKGIRAIFKKERDAL